MARKTTQPKRKRPSIPAEVYKFVESLENFLEVDVSPKNAQNTNANLDVALSKFTLTNSANMIQDPPTTSNPFVSFPALELIDKGLDNVDAATLRRSIDPIWKSLESLDAMAMLNLQPTKEGARVTDGCVIFVYRCIILLLRGTHPLFSLSLSL